MAIYGTLGENNLTALSASISDTAVDIFIYDTSKDSDGGAWRKRTQHTSWYNETLNTATRGSRREFPAVAVIVTTNSGDNGQVIIYDADDPDMPMWMKFNVGYNSPNRRMIGVNSAENLTSSTMLNAKLVTGTRDGAASDGGVYIVDFIMDNRLLYQVGGYFGPHIANEIANRNVGSNSRGTQYGPVTLLVNPNINDVAMTVLPNAPIDDATGLQVPTIAVATDGGVSVIKDDGTVVDIVTSNATYDDVNNIQFTEDNKIVYTEHSGDSYGWMYVHDIPSSDTTITLNTQSSALSYYDTRFPLGNFGQEGWILCTRTTNGDRIDSLAVGGGLHLYVAPRGDSGLTFIQDNRTADKSSLIGYATTSYNTGWMHGDIKGAFLSDTDATNISGTNLVSNGDFSSGATGWADDGSGGTNSFTVNGSGQAVWSVTTGTYWLNQQVYLTPGKTYTIQAELISSNNNRWIRVGSGPGGTSDLFDKMTWVSNEVYQFTVPSNWTNNYWVQFGIQAAGTITFDNVVLKLADPDRSVNNKGLQVFGTVTKSPVAGSGATAAELVAYGGFSTSNYLLQPYNSDFEIGTGDFTHMLWYKGTGSAPNGSVGAREVFTRTAGTTNHWLLYKEYTNYIGFDSIYSPNTVQADVWYHVAVVRKSRVVYLYENGVLVNSAANSKNIADTSGGFMVGQDPANNDWRTRGYLSLVRFSTSTASSEQIKKIYEDEKVLFQENAACTLYGSSDAVTALAYDEKTELLHVGTSSGRSDFNGLRRINNTTSAVTTAISAYDGSIAQQ